MGTTFEEQLIELVLKWRGIPETKDAKAAMDAMAASTSKAAQAGYELADAGYDVVDAERLAAAEVRDHADALTRARAAARAAAEAEEDLERRLRRVTSATEQATDATRRSTSAYTGVSGTMLQLGRAAQDLAQGGPMAVLNNVDSILLSIGGKLARLAGPAVAAATAGLMLYQNWDSVRSLWSDPAMFDRPTSKLDALKEKLEAVNKATETLKGKTKLTADELAQYNAMSLERAKLEGRIADEMERQAIAKAQSQKPAAEAARGDAFNRAVSEGGGAQKLEDDLYNAMLEPLLGPAEERRKAALAPTDWIAESDPRRKAAVAQANQAYQRETQAARNAMRTLAAQMRTQGGLGNQAAIDEIAKVIAADTNGGRFQQGIGSGIGALVTGEADRQAALERRGERRAGQIVEGREAAAQVEREDLAKRQADGAAARARAEQERSDARHAENMRRARQDRARREERQAAWGMVDAAAMGLIDPMAGLMQQGNQLMTGLAGDVSGLLGPMVQNQATAAAELAQHRAYLQQLLNHAQQVERMFGALRVKNFGQQNMR